MFHQEITIPVNRDSRNFEQRRKDMFTKLESNVSTVSTNENKSIATRTRTHNDDLWDMEIKDWVMKSRSSWDQDFAKLRGGLFDLEVLLFEYTSLSLFIFY